MKKHITNILALLSFVFVLSVAQAGAQHIENVRVIIPFDFQASSKMLPAGEYRVVRLNTFTPTYRALRLVGLDGNSSTILKASSVDSRDESLESGLTFLRYGSEYFLSEVSYGSKKVTLNKPSSDDILTAANRKMKPEIITVVFYR